MRVYPGVIFALFLFLTGCVALTSVKGIQGVYSGYTYYLPKSIVTVTVRRIHDTKVGRVWYDVVGLKRKTTGDIEDYTPDLHSITIPDHRFKYAIQYNPSAFSDDRLCVTRTRGGLLHDVHFASDDRTPQIAFNLARFVGGFTGAPVVRRDVNIKNGSYEIQEYSDKIDPFNPEETSAFNAGLRKAFGDQNLTLDFSSMKQIAQSRGNGKKPECNNGQICYRSILKLPFYLKQGGQSIDVAYADVINPWDVGAISVERAFLVEKITKLRFKEGSLIGAVIRKPSEMEELSLLPLNILNGILSVPTGIWKAAFQDTEARKNALAAMVQLSEGVQSIRDSHQRLLTGDVASTVSANAYKINCGVKSRGGDLFDVISGGATQ